MLLVCIFSKHIKHISSAQSDLTFEHWRKHDGRHLHGCTLARFLNISVICLCSYVLDMYFNVLKYKLAPYSICVTLAKFTDKCVRSPDSIVNFDVFLSDVCDQQWKLI